MKCDDIRGLLAAEHEAAPDILEAMFEHIDACPACADAMEAPPPVLTLSAPLGVDFYGAVQGRLEACSSAMTVIDGPAEVEPEASLLESSFDHVDGCGPCRAELSEDTAAVPSGMTAPSFEGFADKVWSQVAGGALVMKVLGAESEPTERELEEAFALIDQGSPYGELEESLPVPVLADYAAQREVPVGAFDNFYEQVEQRLGLSATGPMRIGPASERPVVEPSRSWLIPGAMLALAASMLLLFALWQAQQPENNGSKSIATPKPRNINKPFEDVDFGELEGWKPGKEWLKISSESGTKRESMSNEATLPGRQNMEYSMPGSETPAQPAKGAKSKPQPKRRGSSGTALSF